MFRRALLVLASLAVLVVLVVVARAVTWSAPQPEPVEIAYGEVPDGIATRLAEALRFETVSQYDTPPDPVAYNAFLEWLEATYPLAHTRLEVERVNEYSLLFRWHGSDPGLDPVLLMAHYDVVPVEPGTSHEWTYPPFAGTVADGKVWGRGAMDDKSGVTGKLEAVESLLAEGFEPTRTILLAIGHDEEIGGDDGALAIARMLRDEGLRLAWVLDEGGGVINDHPALGRPVAAIGTAEKGYLSLKLTARAPGGHSSQPAARTAVGILVTAIDRIQDSPFEARLQSPVTDALDVIAGESGGLNRIALTNRWLFGPSLKRRAADDPALNAWVRTTIAPTMLSAGDKDNVLPQRAEGVVNFRLLAGDSVEGVTERVARIIDDERVTIEQYGGFGIEPSPVSPVDDPFFETMGGIVRGLWPDLIVMPNLLSGATDSRHFVPLTDRIYRFKPIRSDYAELSGVHGTDERVDAASYAEGIQFYRTLLIEETSR